MFKSSEKFIDIDMVPGFSIEHYSLFIFYFEIQILNNFLFTSVYEINIYIYHLMTAFAVLEYSHVLLLGLFPDLSWPAAAFGFIRVQIVWMAFPIRECMVLLEVLSLSLINVMGSTVMRCKLARWVRFSWVLCYLHWLPYMSFINLHTLFGICPLAVSILRDFK